MTKKIINIEGIMTGSEIILGKHLVVLYETEVCHEREGISCCHCSRIEIVDEFSVSCGYTRTSHALVVRCTLL